MVHSFELEKEIAELFANLDKSDEVAWAWDNKRLRILWATPAGMEFLRVKDLHELYRRRYDLSKPWVRELDAIAKNPRTNMGQLIDFTFPGWDGEVNLSCTFRTMDMPGRGITLLIMTAKFTNENNASDTDQELFDQQVLAPQPDISDVDKLEEIGQQIKSSGAVHTAADKEDGKIITEKSPVQEATLTEDRNMLGILDHTAPTQEHTRELAALSDKVRARHNAAPDRTGGSLQTLRRKTLAKKPLEPETSQTKGLIIVGKDGEIVNMSERAREILKIESHNKIHGVKMHGVRLLDLVSSAYRQTLQDAFIKMLPEHGARDLQHEKLFLHFEAEGEEYIPVQVDIGYRQPIKQFWLWLQPVAESHDLEFVEETKEVEVGAGLNEARSLESDKTAPTDVLPVVSEASRPDDKAVPAEEPVVVVPTVIDAGHVSREENGSVEEADPSQDEPRTDGGILIKVSHELRTPLNAIIGFAELMKREAYGPLGNDKYRGYVNDIHENAQHALSLVSDLLDPEKEQTGEFKPKFENVRLNDIISSVTSTIHPQAASKQIIVRTSLAPELRMVIADPKNIRQMLLNLLSNAVKFTPKGGQIVISSGSHAYGSAYMRVRNTGAWMSEKELADAMRPYETSDNKTGTGLGLPLTKKLADSNNARFDIKSSPETGTVVEITFRTVETTL
jgi:nitrogen-specific signal transduction histidine kinase